MTPEKLRLVSRWWLAVCLMCILSAPLIGDHVYWVSLTWALILRNLTSPKEPKGKMSWRPEPPQIYDLDGKTYQVHRDDKEEFPYIVDDKGDIHLLFDPLDLARFQARNWKLIAKRARLETQRVLNRVHIGILQTMIDLDPYLQTLIPFNMSIRERFFTFILLCLALMVAVSSLNQLLLP